MEEKANNYKFTDTTATRKIFELDKRIRAVCGGTSASKTISILIWCIDYAQTHKGELISVVSESFPHLSGGAMLDFENIMKDRGYWKDDCWIKTPRGIYTFENGSKIEFMSVDTYGKAHGPRRDVLFINEANNLSYIIADQLITRTRKIVWMDWNPSREFYFYTEMLNKRDDIDFITLTYLDNEALDEVTVKEIESHKHNKNWWKVYGLGELGEIEGKIYKDWKMIEEIPHEARLERIGLDFGYSQDPTSICAVYKWNQAFIVDELLHQKGRSNRQIAEFLQNLEEQVMVVADSAEPKSIDELKEYGIDVVGAKKGQGSVNYGIQLVQDQRIFYTKRSLNIKKSYDNYMWKTDKDGVILTVPDHYLSDPMDAIRYAMETLNIETGLSEVEKYMRAEARRNSGNNYAR